MRIGDIFFSTVPMQLEIMLSNDMNQLVLIFIILLSTSPALATERILKIQKQVDPIEHDPLVDSFEIEIQSKELKYDFAKGEPYYLSKMVTKIQTKQSADLSKYGVVQFIRGCLYTTRQKTDGTIEYSLENVRDFFGENVTFKHPEWVIDSVDTDPIYWSAQDQSIERVGLYRLDNPMLHARPEDRLYFYKHFTDQKAYYVRDMPTGATNYEGSYLNNSLEFKTCLYRLSDVPEVSDPSGHDLYGKELKCFAWKSNFTFNYDLKKFEMLDSIHPFCLE